MPIARSSMFFGAGTLLSRLTGLLRDRIMFGVFGASTGLDAFIIAMRIPNLFRELLAEGALGSAFTKVFSEIAVSDQKRAAELLKESLVIVSLLAVLLVLFGMAIAPWMVDLMTMMAPSDTAAALSQEATGLVRVLFPIFGFMLVGAVAMGALHQQGRFFLTATAPVLFNLGYIIGALFFAGALMAAEQNFNLGVSPGLLGLALGVVVGAALQMGVQLMGLWKTLKSVGDVKIVFKLTPEMKKVLVLMTPMVIAACSAQVNQVLVTNFSASLEPGTVTRLQAAFRLLHLPIALFAVALGVTALPALTRAITAAKGMIDRSTSLVLQNAIELVLWLMVPCLVYYAKNSEVLIAFLFQSGRFGENDVRLAGAALSIYAFALIAYGLNKVLVSFYFSIDRTSYPMKVSLFGIAVNLTFLTLFISWGIEGLAAAFSCSLSINTLLLIVGMRGQGIQFDGRRLFRSLGTLAGAAVLTFVLQRMMDGLYTTIPSSLPIWLRSGLELLGNGLLVLGVMLGGASFYLDKSPIKTMKMMRRR